MIPNLSILNTEITETELPTRTYKIEMYQDRMKGYTDELEATIQAIYLILNTERYKHIIYSWDYGVELYDLFGKPMTYVIAEIPRRITEALLQDERITDVSNFKFNPERNRLYVTFDVIAIYGTVNASKYVYYNETAIGTNPITNGGDSNSL